MEYGLANCRVCGGQTKSILDLGQSPVANALLSDPCEQLETYSLGLEQCVDCTLVQNSSLLPNSLLFPDSYPYFASVSLSVLRHADDIATALAARLKCGATTVEIGSNDGAVQRSLASHGITSIGVDPATGPALQARSLGCDVINSVFDEHAVNQILSKTGSVDAVHMSNVLAHTPSPLQLLQHARSVLNPQGILMIEVQSWLDLVSAGAFDMVYHEHHSHFSLTSLAHLLQEAGFGITTVEKTRMQGGSLRLWCAQDAAHHQDVKAQILSEKQRLDLAAPQLANSFAKFQTEMRTFADALGDAKLFGYGAAAKTVTLLAASGVDLPLRAVADAAPSKIGKYLPVGGIPIVSPKTLEGEEPDVVLLFAWNLAAEIVPKLACENVWVPIPILERVK